MTRPLIAVGCYYLGLLVGYASHRWRCWGPR
jgi:hypothetical protein